jgi:hypothetical protein
MAKLLLEVWERVEDGMVLHACCYAGPLGDDHRSMMPTNARLITTFTAGSHFEAMTIYHRILGREPYTTKEPWDYEPYPEEWRETQQSANRDDVHRAVDPPSG